LKIKLFLFAVPVVTLVATHIILVYMVVLRIIKRENIWEINSKIQNKKE